MRLTDLTRASETRSGLWLALTVALVLKSLMLVCLSGQPINNDGVLYVAAAQELARGQVGQSLAIYHMPLVPLLIAAMHVIVPDWLTAGRLVSLVTVILALFPLYLTTRDLFGARAAFFTGMAYALAPFPGEFVVDIYRGGPYFLFLAWAVFFAQRGVRTPRARHFVLGAMFSGAAGMCRVEGIVFVAIATLFFCICLPLTARGQRGALVKAIAAWSAVFLVALAAFLAVLGPDHLSAEGFAAAAARFQSLFQVNPLENYHELYRQLKTLGELSPYPSGNQNFAEIARHWIVLIYLVGMLETLIGVIFFPFCIALLAGLKHAWTRASALLMWTVVWYLLFVWATLIARDFIQTRFLFAPAFLLYPWVGNGLERIWRRVAQARRRRLASAVFAVFFFVSPLADSAYLVTTRDTLLTVAGRWIAQNPELASADKFFNDGRLAFHSGQGWVEFKDNHDRWQASGESMETFARANGIDVVVQRYSRGKKPEAWGAFNDYRRIKTFEDDKQVVEVYAAPAMAPQRRKAGTRSESSPP